MYCCLKWCENNTHNKSSKNISFHQFPKAEEKKQKWMEILKLNEIDDRSYVCSNHFHEGDFIDDDNRRRLFLSAMPSLPKHMEEPSESTSNDIDVDIDTLISHSSSSTSSESSDSSDDNFDVECLRDKKMSLKRALYSSDDSCSSSELSPECKRLKGELQTLRKSVFHSQRIIKTLNEKLRRKTRSLDLLNEKFLDLKKLHLIPDAGDVQADNSTNASTRITNTK